MRQWQVGVLLIGIGIALMGTAVAAGVLTDDDPPVADSLISDSDEGDSAGASPADGLDADTPRSTSSTATTQPSTTQPPTSGAEATSSTTSTTTTTTSTTTTTTTTTLPPEAAVAAFVEEFSTAIGAADVDWLLQRLNGSIVLGYGEEVCRAFIEAEILQLEQYELNGAVVGPATKTLPTGVGEISVSNIYTADVSFVFRGSAFDSKADFVWEDPITWLATCR